MYRPIHALLLLFSFLNLLTAAAQVRGSQSTITRKEDLSDIYGIVIGVSEYDNQPRLQYADKDAESVYRFLTSLQKKRDDAGNISLFTNRQASRDAIVEKLYDLNDKVKKGDRVYIYFGGHGDMEHLDQTRNCLLLLSNSPRKNYLRVSNSYLDINLFTQFISSWSSREVRVFFICDACHSGSLSGGETGRNNTILSLQQAWNNDVKMLSCQPNELSLEGEQWGGGRGLFSFYLVAGLQGLADRNRDSVVSLYELKRFVEDSVGTYSENTQMPEVSGGNSNLSLSRYDAPMYATARSSLKNGAAGYTKVPTGSVAFKGNEEESVMSTLRDSSHAREFRSYLVHVRSGELISPRGDCALSVYESFPEGGDTRVARGYMKLKLLNLLQQGFDEMIAYLYDDRFEQFDFGRRYEIERNLAVCVQLGSQNQLLFNRLRARQLFLAACNSAMGIQTGVPVTGRIAENLQTGIDSLRMAIQLDPMAPFLYLRIGDYYLFSSNFKDAISAYEIYRQQLPNDEYACNKLGFALAQSRQYARAAEMFRRAIALNPSFAKAKENLAATLARMQ